MKIICLIFLATCTISVKSEYPRFKRRGPPHPPQPPRMPPMSNHMKKWPPPFPSTHRLPPVPQQQVRTRPIPVHMPTAHKIPMGTAPAQPRPVVQPVRNFWKNNQVNPGKLAQQEKHQFAIKHSKDKPFLSSPSMSLQEYDYHLQSNSIPTHTNTIKQVGEKGPIHTIPAPNLSPADRPANVLEENRNHEVRFQKSPYSEAASHQYQVTESNEPLPKPKVYRPNPQQHILLQQQQLQLQEQQEQQKAFFFDGQEETKQQHQQQIQQQLQQQQVQHQQAQQQYFPQDNHFLTQNLLMSQPQPQQLFNFDTVALPQASEHVAQGVSGAPSSQQNQQLHTQAIQSSFYQQHPEIANFQTFMNQPSQLYQPDRQESQILDSLHQVASDKSIDVQPEYHNFNYDEQAYQKSIPNSKGGISGLVSAGYNLDGSSGISEQIVSGTNSRSSMDPLEQAQIVQSYFDTRQEPKTEKPVTPDTASSSSENHEEHLIPANLYSSLPNKETAERLAQLQNAGKINSNLMKIPATKVIESKNPMTIYVPDDDLEQKDETRDQSIEYEDDYDQDEENKRLDAESQVFGHKIQK